MNEKKYSVYIHNFPNGKKYVGLTYQLPERRWNNGNGYKNQYVYNAIMEFGWDNVEHTVVQKDLSAHEASILEQELIEKYDTIKNGYNRTAGGELSAGTPYLYMYKDKKYTIYELADTFGIAYHALRWRFQKGWSVEDAVEIPQEEKYNIYRYNGKPYTVYELAEMNGSGITPHGIQTSAGIIQFRDHQITVGKKLDDSGGHSLCNHRYGLIHGRQGGRPHKVENVLNKAL